MSSRIKVEFIKSHLLNGVKCIVGSKATMRVEKASELIRLKIVREYTGEWPPKEKTKTQLKELK
jgi:hypothetical protein